MEFLPPPALLLCLPGLPNVLVPLLLLKEKKAPCSKVLVMYASIFVRPCHAMSCWVEKKYMYSEIVLNQDSTPLPRNTRVYASNLFMAL
jgi:hypothetical protein